MKDQEFIDIELGKDESLATVLQTIVIQKREEMGTQAVYVQNVVPTDERGFTIILKFSHTPY